MAAHDDEDARYSTRPLVPGQGWLITMALDDGGTLTEPVIAWSEDDGALIAEDGFLTSLRLLGNAHVVWHPDAGEIEIPKHVQRQLAVAILNPRR